MAAPSRTLLQAVALGLLLSFAPLWAAPPEPLAARLQALLSEPRFAAASWGVKVVSLDTGRTLFAHQAEKFFTPASNTKLFTAALVLQTLGPEFRIRTSLYGQAKPGPGGVLQGDLVLFGRGDPTVLGWNQGGPDPLEALATQAWEAGVRVVTGDLVGDDRFFATPPFGSGWEAGDLAAGFGAPPTALVVHGNTVNLRIYPAAPGQPCLVFPMPGLHLLALDNGTTTRPGGVGIRAYRALGEGTVHLTGALPPGAPPAELTVTLQDPALFFAQLLRRALLRHGIRVLGATRSRHVQNRNVPLDTPILTELGHLESPPLRSILRDTLKDSLNLEAQVLFLQAGAARSGPGPHTEARALEALAAYLEAAGLSPGQVLLEEGSGLSRKNLVTPSAIVALLAHLSRTPGAELFREALPLAGVDGSLARRMAGTPAQGNLRAKTGTMRFNHALSGYVTSAAGERLAFAILLNNYNRDPQAPSPQSELDALAVCLAESR
jgi:D-alanyl-D-alanine carboxypeptidase/D-alanyl-D-alanine-endopeptidase (penicillin-binding protein 4)